MEFRGIKISDYTYELPEERIAQYPLQERDRSRLLIAVQGRVSEDLFFQLAEHLPENSLLVRNVTKVIHARLNFKKQSGALIEIFCLEPIRPFTEIHQALQGGSGCEWNCLIGNARKWKYGPLTQELSIDGHPLVLTAEKTEAGDGQFVVRFTWAEESITWAEILEAAGKIPLPPYITRHAEKDDLLRYQTVFASTPGSVAAPTAGLHFSDDLLRSLANKGIRQTDVTLHVGAGTFKPVETEFVDKHKMHPEQILVDRTTVEALLNATGSVISVGTTTLRTLESLYWLGAKVNETCDLSKLQQLGQWEPYSSPEKQGLDRRQSLENILTQMDKQGVTRLRAVTQLMIVPGYHIRSSDHLITNFHQPGSTLLLLVAAFAGDIWKEAYAYALKHSFRFLSYGDACLFKVAGAIGS